jgi:hypothetical protein
MTGREYLPFPIAAAFSGRPFHKNLKRPAEEFPQPRQTCDPVFRFARMKEQPRGVFSQSNKRGADPLC